MSLLFYHNFNLSACYTLHIHTLVSKALQINYLSPFTLRNPAVNQI